MQAQQAFMIEKNYDAPVEKIWEAITDKNQMKQWYFDISEFEPEVGFEFQFNGGNEDKIYVHLCRIIEVIPNKKLKYSWQYKDYQGMSFVTFELFNEGKTTRLTLIHEDLETFPQDNSDFAKERFAEGWTYITGTSLKEFLEKAQVSQNN